MNCNKANRQDGSKPSTFVWE